jgi:type I restriction enzyme M protein
VVIEEDGKTEDEFISEVIAINDELETLNSSASALEKIIANNLAKLVEA